MTYLRSGLLAALVVVSWLILVTLLAPIHRVGFALVPPDGAVSETVRQQLDTTVSEYLVWGDVDVLHEFSAPEQAHLADVRQLLAWAIVSIGVLLIGLYLGRSQPVDMLMAARATLALGLGALLIFPIAFEWFHRIAFFGKDNWYLPSDQFLLTQLYPIGFFAGMWLLVVLLAALSILVLRRFLSGSDVAK